MKRLTITTSLISASLMAAAAALVLAPGGGLAPRAAAQDAEPPKLHNEGVYIQYLPPRSDKYQQLYERLKKRQILEELDAFLSPLDLGDNGLTLSLEEGDPKECTGPNSYYDGRGALHLCYSWFYFLENEVAKEYPRAASEPFTLTTPGLMPGFTRAEVIIGGVVSVTLHELGHAVFDLLSIPRFGREEDAADQFAAYMMVHFGPNVSLPTIKGAYNVWHHANAIYMKKVGGIRPSAEADAHSLDIQRTYSFLCMAYGKDPDTFKELAENLLPRARRDVCQSEYEQAELAFRKTILPKLDPKLMQEVGKMTILRPEDFKL